MDNPGEFDVSVSSLVRHLHVLLGRWSDEMCGSALMFLPSFLLQFRMPLWKVYKGSRPKELEKRLNRVGLEHVRRS